MEMDEFLEALSDAMPEVGIQVGDKVHYFKENGIVKRIAEGGCWVVYNCNNDWENYKDYTAAYTSFSNIQIGWYGEI